MRMKMSPIWEIKLFRKREMKMTWKIRKTVKRRMVTWKIRRMIKNRMWLNQPRKRLRSWNLTKLSERESKRLRTRRN